MNLNRATSPTSSFPSTDGWKTWMLPYRFGAIVFLPPPGPLTSHAAEWREKLDLPSAHSAPPHITISQPFAAPPDAQALERIAQVFQRSRAFPIRVGPAVPSPNNQMAWLDVWPQERFYDLREDLHATELFRTDLPLTKNFIFHMTLCERSCEASEVDSILLEWNTQFRVFNSECSEACWTVPNEDFVFSQRQVFRFSS